MAPHTKLSSLSTRPSMLFQRWIHSHEEDHGILHVYRPESFDFPPSFSRDGFEMRPDGEFVQEDFKLDDGTVRTRGCWVMHENRVVTVTLGGHTQCGLPRTLTFGVLSVDDAVLRIIRLTRQQPHQPDDEQQTSCGPCDPLGWQR
jgi:hypothetical protein